MAAFPLPVNLLDSVHSDRSPSRDEWLAALPAVVAEFANRWSLRLGPPELPSASGLEVADGQAPPSILVHPVHYGQ